MKRLRFNNPFNGMGNALKLIPESYKVDGKEFELTDGVESYKVRWEKTPTILTASNKNLMNEDMQKMKHLMQYNSKDTLGNLRGKERINENKVFNDVWGKTKKLIKEGLSKKAVSAIQKWIGEDDYRGASKKIIDSVLQRKLGLGSSDLGDTAIFANGLDTVEDFLKTNEYEQAFESAKETAREMIEDEGLYESENNNKLSKTKKQIDETAFGFGFTGEGNLEENEEENDETKVIDIQTLTKKQQKAIKDTIEIMKKINNSDDSIDEDSIDGKDGEPSPEIPYDDAKGIEGGE